MTASVPSEQDGLGGASEVAALRAELANADGTRLARYTARARTAARILAALVVSTGVLALLVGVAAWRDETIGLVAVTVLCLPAIVTPLFVARRAGTLAMAAGHPREMAVQIQDLAVGLRDSVELRRLARLVSGRRSGRRPGRGRPPEGFRPGKLRGALSLARMASAVVGQAQPDPTRHPLLLPFTPERLRHTWAGVIISLWAWLVASLVLLVSIPALTISFL